MIAKLILNESNGECHQHSSTRTFSYCVVWRVVCLNANFGYGEALRCVQWLRCIHENNETHTQVDVLLEEIVHVSSTCCCHLQHFSSFFLYIFC